MQNTSVNVCNILHTYMAWEYFTGNHRLYYTNRLPIVSVNTGVFTVIVFTLCLFAAAVSNAAYSSEDGDI